MSAHEDAENLLRAFSSRDLPAIRRLAEAGLDLDVPGGGELTVLMRAVLRGEAIPVEWILAAGADPDTRTADGMTALDFARQIDRPELVELLLAAGASAGEDQSPGGEVVESAGRAAVAMTGPRLAPDVFEDERADSFSDEIHDEVALDGAATLSVG